MSDQRMKIERAVKVLTGILPFDRDEVREAWSVVADIITERAQHPPRPTENRRDGALDFETYKAKVEIVGANLSSGSATAERGGEKKADESLGSVPLRTDEKMAPHTGPSSGRYTSDAINHFHG